MNLFCSINYNKLYLLEKICEEENENKYAKIRISPDWINILVHLGICPDMGRHFGTTGSFDNTLPWFLRTTYPGIRTNYPGVLEQITPVY